MGDKAPLTLLQLARERVLREEASIICHVEKLPKGVFPVIFEAALTEKRTNLLRAMVPAWPFSCLPAGDLLETPCLETLKVLLDGLYVLISEKLNPRSAKLRVLDLTHEHHDLWRIRFRSYDTSCSSSQDTEEKEPVEICSKSKVEKPFMVVTDLEIMMSKYNECDTYLLSWAKQHNSSVHLCCRKLHILNSPVDSVIRLFKIVHLDCILQLQVNVFSLEFLAHIFPYLGQMRSLHTFMMEEIYSSRRPSTSQDPERINLLLSQLSQLGCLKNLHLDKVYFLTGRLEELLRCLKKPLESLSITHCELLWSDLDFLCQGLNICELRHLNLKCINLSALCPKVLGVLFERLKSTLQTLELEDCSMDDFDFRAILPALSQCSQLTKINFYSNRISLLTLKNLLHHTARLSKLTEELYPAPRECYGKFTILRDKFQELCPQLLDILRAQRQPKKVCFRTTMCRRCFHFCFYDSEARLCRCV